MTLHTPPALPRRLKLIRKLTFATILIALYALIAIPPAAAQTAQNEPHGNHRAQAALQIQAQVVPVTYPPSERRSDRAPEDAVIYNVSSRQPGMTMVEEIHPVSGADVVAWHEGRAVQAAVLKTLTVVLQ